MLLGRRRFLQLLATAGAALVVPRAAGPIGSGTSAATGLTSVVYPPSPGTIGALDNLVRGLDPNPRRLWALGQVPNAGAGAIYLDGVKVATLREWTWTREVDPIGVSVGGQMHYMPSRSRNYGSAKGTWVKGLGLEPTGEVLGFELRSGTGEVYQAEGYASQVLDQLGGFSVEYELRKVRCVPAGDLRHHQG